MKSHNPFVSGMSSSPAAKVSDIRWLTPNQTEMKARLQIQGKVAGLYESSATVNEDTYIPEHSQVKLDEVQADKLFRLLKEEVAPETFAYKFLEKTRYHGTNVSIFLWGLVYQEQLYIIRIAVQDEKVCQIWCAWEGATDFQANTDPVICYLVSLVYP